MLARLWWKEWRAFAPALLLLAVVAAVLQGLFLSTDAQDARLGGLTVSALPWAVLYAFAAGAAAFSAEREGNTLGFLDALPVGRRTLWLAKATFALASTLGLALVLAGLAALGTRTRDPDDIYGYVPIARTFGTLMFEGVAWGLLWSSMSRNPLVAGGMAVVSVYGSAVAMDRLAAPRHLLASNDFVAAEAVPARVLAALAALAASALVMAWRPGAIGRAWSKVAWRDERPGGIPVRRASVSRSLAWQAIREGWTTGLLVAIVGLVVPGGAVLRGVNAEGPIGLLLAILAALVAGVAVFGRAGGAGSRRFLVHHGVEPGAVWGWRMGIWGLVMAAFLASFLVAFIRFGPIRPGRMGLGLVLTGSAVLDAFAVGVACGMAIPRPITAVMVGVIGMLVLAPIQIALGALDMVPDWSLLLSPMILLGAGRAWAGDWMAGREGIRPWARLGLFLAVPFGLLGSAYVGWRAWGVPDVGPQFDVAAEATPIPPGQDAAGAYRRALALARPYAGPPSTSVDQDAPPVEEMIFRGWDPKRADVVAWWEANRPALELARRASALPKARFGAVARPTLESPTGEVVPGLRVLSNLLALDARERQARGDLPGAWDDILAQLRMADQLTANGPTVMQAMVAADIHHRAVGLAIDWAGDPRQSAGTIRAARDDLKGVPPPPTAEGVLRGESGLLERTLDLSARDLDRVVHAGSGIRGSAAESLAFTRVVAPWWERERARRLVRRQVAALRPEAGREPWQRAGNPRFDAVPEGSPLTRLMFPNFGPVVDALDREATRRRALEQVLALRSWQFGHGGAYPGTLADLVPSELPRLPLDPYSGRPFGYVRSGGEPARPPIRADLGPESDLRPTRPGQPILYSVGPSGRGDRAERRAEEKLRGGDMLFPIP